MFASIIDVYNKRKNKKIKRNKSWHHYQGGQSSTRGRLLPSVSGWLDDGKAEKETLVGKHLFVRPSGDTSVAFLGRISLKRAIKIPLKEKAWPISPSGFLSHFTSLLHTLPTLSCTQPWGIDRAQENSVPCSCTSRPVSYLNFLSSTLPSLFKRNNALTWFFTTCFWRRH